MTTATPAAAIFKLGAALPRRWLRTVPRFVRALRQAVPMVLLCWGWTVGAQVPAAAAYHWSYDRHIDDELRLQVQLHLLHVKKAQLWLLSGQLAASDVAASNVAASDEAAHNAELSSSAQHPPDAVGSEAEARLSASGNVVPLVPTPGSYDLDLSGRYGPESFRQRYLAARQLAKDGIRPYELGAEQRMSNYLHSTMGIMGTEAGVESYLRMPQTEFINTKTQQALLDHLETALPALLARRGRHFIELTPPDGKDARGQELDTFDHEQGSFIHYSVLYLQARYGERSRGIFIQGTSPEAEPKAASKAASKVEPKVEPAAAAPLEQGAVPPRAPESGPKS